MRKLNQSLKNQMIPMRAGETIRSKYLFFALIFFVAQAAYGAEDQFTFKTKAPIGREGQRLLSFKMDVNGAYVSRLSNVPRGWAMSFVNSSSGTATISGNVDAGVAARDLDFLSRLITLSKDSTDPIKGIEINAEVELSGSPDYDKFESKKLEAKDFIINKTN
jgi:hypothetical protein